MQIEGNILLVLHPKSYWVSQEDQEQPIHFSGFSILRQTHLFIVFIQKTLRLVPRSDSPLLVERTLTANLRSILRREVGPFSKRVGHLQLCLLSFDPNNMVPDQRHDKKSLGARKGQIG